MREKPSALPRTYQMVCFRKTHKALPSPFRWVERQGEGFVGQGEAASTASLRIYAAHTHNQQGDTDDLPSVTRQVRGSSVLLCETETIRTKKERSYERY